MNRFVCDVCGWVYDEAEGYEDGGIAPGTLWADVPEDFECPLCGVGKDQFSQESFTRKARFQIFRKRAFFRLFSGHARVDLPDSHRRSCSVFPVWPPVPLQAGCGPAWGKPPRSACR